MPKKDFLHNHPDFAGLMNALSRKMKIAPQLIEKDYWLMHVLWALQELKLKYELKGGTSLSKGWGLLNRFSEDVDLKILPPDDMQVPFGKNQKSTAQKEKRNNYFEWILETLRIPGATYVRRDKEFDDKDLRNAGFRIGYKSYFDEIPGLKHDILLEVGYGTTTPNEPKDISSWAYDEAETAGLEIITNRAMRVPCYLPEYTLVEKLDAISRRYRRELQGEILVNFTRHYYDVYQLLGEERVQAFLGSEEYMAHKNSKFRSEEADIKNNPAFTMPDIEVRAKYAARLKNSSSLYFYGQPTLDEILARLKEYLGKL